MIEIILHEEKNVSPDLKTALALMQCTEENPAFSELCDIYKENEDAVKSLIRPKGAFAFDKLRVNGGNEDLFIGRDVVYSMATLGPEIVEYIRKKSDEDMLEGMMVDFMADSALFNYGELLAENIRAHCIEKGLGIHQGYEAPNLIPMEAQRDTWEILQAEKNLGITITDGYMLRPIKSNGHIYTISNDVDEFNIKHDCKNCGMINCPMRGMNL